MRQERDKTKTNREKIEKDCKKAETRSQKGLDIQHLKKCWQFSDKLDAKSQF